MTTLKPGNELVVLQSLVELGDPHFWIGIKDWLNPRVAVYESLVRLGAGNRFHPALAKSWRCEEDARTWTFELGDDVQFHNGEMLRAQDVIATLERVCKTELPGDTGTTGLYQEYLGGSIFEAIGDHTVRITTPRPMADLLDLLSKIPIPPGDILADLANTPLGSGPYRFMKADDDSITMKRFEKYWGGKPPVEELIWKAEPNAERRVAALLAGEADIITNVSPDSKGVIEEAEGFEVIASETTMSTIFMCNAQKGVCTDKRVRQALNYALDKDLLIETVMGGAALPMNGPWTPMQSGHDPSTQPYPYDPEEARRLLAEAGHSAGLELTIDIPTILPDEAPELAQFLTGQYAKIGITTQVTSFSDRQEYALMVKSKQIGDICCFDSNSFGTYQCLREKFHSGVAGSWWQGYDNPEVNALFEQARETIDGEVRGELYRRTFKIIRDDAPWIFLYNPISFWGVGPRARGWTVDADGLVRLV